MRIRIHCELCEKDYYLDSGEPWVGLMSCPHDACYHTLVEVENEGVIDDDR